MLKTLYNFIAHRAIDQDLGRAFQRLSLRFCRGKKNHFARIGSLTDARAGDVILRLIRAQGRVVRQEARTRSSCEYDGVESEADMFKLSVEHYHEISQIPMRRSAPLRLKGPELQHHPAEQCLP